MANSITARPLEQGVVDLEDAEMVVVDLGSEYLEKLEPLSSLKSQVQLEGEPGGSNS